MSQKISDVQSIKDEKSSDGFLDCIAYVMAKRWLKDQRSSGEETPKREVTFVSNDKQE